VPPNPGARRAVVVGDVINDILVKPAGPVVRGSDTTSVIRARPGGSAATQAAWMGHLGLDVTFAGRCGARDADFHRHELERFGVRAWLAVDEEADTGSIVIMVGPDGERTMFTDRGANLRLSRSDVPDAILDGAAVLHLTGYTFFSPSLCDMALSLIGAARDRGVAVTVDPGSAAFLARLAPGEFLRWTEGAAICFPNQDEAAILTGGSAPAGSAPAGSGEQREPAAMAAELAGHYGAVVLKLGGLGCVLAVQGAEPQRFDAPAVDVQDTTGAGDAFCAAFLRTWLAPDLDARVDRSPGSGADGRLGGGVDPGPGGGADGRPGSGADGRLDSDRRLGGGVDRSLAVAAEFAVRIAATAVTTLGGRPQPQLAHPPTQPSGHPAIARPSGHCPAPGHCPATRPVPGPPASAPGGRLCA
jgi:sugar/nucleoside kinase (ribokinase family)